MPKLKSELEKEKAEWRSWRILKIVSKGDYNYAIVPNHPNATKNGYVLEHRIVIENHLRRLLTADEVVHHKNEIKKDNRVENLEVMSASEHAALHSSTGRTVMELVCSECGIFFIKEKRNVSLREAHFCSRSCATRYQWKHAPPKSSDAGCGTRASYIAGCRCDKCRKANTECSREFRRKRRTS